MKIIPKELISNKKYYLINAYETNFMSKMQYLYFEVIYIEDIFCDKFRSKVGDIFIDGHLLKYCEIFNSKEESIKFVASTINKYKNYSLRRNPLGNKKGLMKHLVKITQNY